MDVLEEICSEEAERHRVSLRLTAEEREANQECTHICGIGLRTTSVKSLLTHT